MIQIDEEGFRRYVFDKKKLNEYHQNNQEAFKQALESRIDIVVCDNTNFESWQSKPYTDMAREFGYKILLIDFKPRELELHLEAQKITKNVLMRIKLIKMCQKECIKSTGFLVLAWIRPRF
ncbi:AAA family ATPase [Helicobacter pylori]|uniref:AAA family ATPase n=1 Tax=Helicobacter pylori TaxID=210 RepID=UPI0009B27B9F|nr:AAA family ATPase [Helicobacter pylori]